jgi:hypothetical protein
VIDFRSVLHSLKGLLALPRILHPNAEISFYLRFARQLHQEGLRENALQVVDHLQGLVGKYEEASLRSYGFSNVGEVRAELGDRKGAEEAFSQVYPLIKKIHASSRHTNLVELWLKQKKALDPSAEKTYPLALTAIEALTPAERPAAYGLLSQKLVEVGEIPLARKIIDKMPAGYNRLWSLGDLAAKWAEIAQVDLQHLIYAVATFKEALAELKKTRELQGKDYYQYGSNHLITRLTQSGEPFQVEAFVLIEEFRQFILNEIKEPWKRYLALENLIPPLLQLKKHAEVKALLRGELENDRPRRSRGLMLLACTWPIGNLERPGISFEGG